MKNKITRVDLVTGFLGAGKTTFIQKYGAFLDRNNISFAVVENEYGKAGVDTAVLKSVGMQTRELSGGCICCTLKVGFHDLLLELCEEGVERIIVEPSGVYEVMQFFSVMNSPILAGKCETGSVICIVDPTQLDVYDQEETAFLKNQLSMAGGILLSRTQLLEKECVDAAVSKISDIVLENTMLYADDWSHLGGQDFEKLMHLSHQTAEGYDSDTDHSKLFQSCTITADKSFEKEEIIGIIGEIMAGSCGNIMRIKGFVNLKSGSVVVNAVPGLVTVEESSGELNPLLNVIGLGINRKKIKEMLKG